MTRRALALAALLVVLPLAGCASESDVKVAVTGTDDECAIADDTLEAGAITFEFTNEAGDISELYVLRDDGSVVAEVENVPTNQSRNLNVDLSAGEYRVTCKPGQQGDGISSSFTVTGEGGASAPEVGREIPVTAVDYSYEPADVTADEGEAVTFVMANDGTVQHEMEVFDPSGTAIGEIGPTDPGDTGRFSFTPAEPGTYRLVCGIDDHEEQGMVGTLVVG